MWIFDFVLRIFWFFFCTKNFLFGLIFFPEKEFGDLSLSNFTLSNTTSSFSTTSTSGIPSSNRRSTGLHPYIYFRLCPFQMRTAASRTEAVSICLFRTSLRFRVQRNIVPLWVTKFELQNLSYKFWVTLTHSLTHSFNTLKVTISQRSSDRRTDRPTDNYTSRAAQGS